MLKTNLTTTTAHDAVDKQSFTDAATAIVMLDLPEDKFMLQLSACAVYTDAFPAMSPTNFDRFYRLLD